MDDEPLDPAKVAYFQSRYGALDDEGLAELAARRDTLADEAIAALSAEISRRGISVAAVTATYTPAPETPLEQQVSLARELWAGPASRIGQIICIVALGSIGGLLNRLLPTFGGTPAESGYGALLAGLIVATLGYVGYRVGRYCTREICANGDKPISQRRIELRWFAVGVAVLYFLLLSAQIPRM
jgi:hypothetical protein